MKLPIYVKQPACGVCGRIMLAARDGNSPRYLPVKGWKTATPYLDVYCDNDDCEQYSLSITIAAEITEGIPVEV